MKALILVNIQNDFLPGGVVAVPLGNEVVPVANQVQSAFSLIVATQDWHPPHHGSFAPSHAGAKPWDVIQRGGRRQVLWPPHCVQHTGGAAFAPGLETARITRIFLKGTHPDIDSYSGFFDNDHTTATGLGDFLHQRGVREAYVLGLATEYSVKATAVDACNLGFRTYLVLDGCRGVNLHPGDVERAVEEMKSAGVVVLTSDEFGAAP